MMKNIAVFCGASIGKNTIYSQQAKALGLFLANKNIGLVYGGGKIGLMGVLADTVMQNGGEVIGVIPEHLRHEEVEHREVSKMLITKTMAARKIKISQLADGYIALAGGFGTLDELFEALTLGQLAIENKPVAILNTNGFYDNALKQLDVMVQEGFLKQANRDMLLVADTIEALFSLMQNYKAPPLGKVINAVVK